jgi:hypothetical protein
MTRNDPELARLIKAAAYARADIDCFGNGDWVDEAWFWGKLIVATAGWVALCVAMC